MHFARGSRHNDRIMTNARTTQQATWHIDIVAEADGKGFYVTVPALPGCFSWGKTVEQAAEHAREAIRLHLAASRIDHLTALAGSHA